MTTFAKTFQSFEMNNFYASYNPCFALWMSLNKTVNTNLCEGPTMRADIREFKITTLLNCIETLLHRTLQEQRVYAFNAAFSVFVI